MRGRGGLATTRAKLATDPPKYRATQTQDQRLKSPPVSFARGDEIGSRGDQLHNAVCLIGSNQGHATTDTDIRFKSRFETSGEFPRDILLQPHARKLRFAR